MGSKVQVNLIIADVSFPGNCPQAPVVSGKLPVLIPQFGDRTSIRFSRISNPVRELHKVYSIKFEVFTFQCHGFNEW